MAKRTRAESQLAWWATIGAVGVATLYTGSWKLGALTMLLWSMYELCFCPITCSVATRRGGLPCRNGARGRLFACTQVPGHQRIKTDALWRLAGKRNPLARFRVTYDEVPSTHQRAQQPSTPLSPEPGYVEPNQRFMTYIAIIGLAATLVQTATGLASM